VGRIQPLTADRSGHSSEPAGELHSRRRPASARCSSPLCMTTRSASRTDGSNSPNQRPADASTRPRPSGSIPRHRGAQDSTRVRCARRVRAAPATSRSGATRQIALSEAGTRHQRPRSRHATPSARTHPRRSKRKTPEHAAPISARADGSPDRGRRPDPLTHPDPAQPVADHASSSHTTCRLTHHSTRPSRPNPEPRRARSRRS
jgi:hypothetical protein